MNIRKKSTRRRPTVESLESMTLLSTVTAGMLHAAKAPPVIVAPTPAVVVLSGTIHASGKVTGAGTGTASGSGNLGKVGTASFKVSIDLKNPPSAVTLTTKHGKLYLAGDNTLFTGSTSGTSHYTITGGTGSYLHATGSGNVSGSYSLLRGNKLSITLSFTA